jgi:hypothetical protein
MPFVMAEVFEDCMLPKNLEPYWKQLIEPLFDGDDHYYAHQIKPWDTDEDKGIDNEIGEICYLTIQESYVEANTSQRRPGLHTDNPGKLQIKCDGQCILDFPAKSHGPTLQCFPFLFF